MGAPTDYSLLLNMTTLGYTLVYSSLGLLGVVAMLEMVAGLWLASVIVELIIVAKIKWLRELMETQPIMSLVFSIGVSWLLGMIFGAAGLIVFFAAMASTITTWLIYRVMNVGSKVVTAVKR